uniref:Uncharacterized protein n=1 Tax=Cacopsylla melanoneura TaxID=428564 RepID=A0A8D9ELB4_9HEMI
MGTDVISPMQYNIPDMMSIMDIEEEQPHQIEFGLILNPNIIMQTNNILITTTARTMTMVIKITIAVNSRGMIVGTMRITVAAGVTWIKVGNGTRKIQDLSQHLVLVSPKR